MNACRLKATSVLLVLAAVLAPRAHAAWSPTGAPVCVAPGAQHDPVTSSPYVAWLDERDGVPQVYVTSISPWTGDLGLPVNGLHAAPSATAQDQLALATSSWDGSVFIAWSEDRGLGTGRDIYVLRLLGGAAAPGWPANGLRVCGAPGDQTHPRLVLDHPHAIIAWDDARGGDTDLFAQDVDDSGTSMPGWPADGRALVTNPGADHFERLLRFYDYYAGVDRFVLLWSNSRRILTQVMQADGSLFAGPDWPATGRVVSDSAYVASAPAVIDAIVQFDSRYLVAWLEDHGGVPQMFCQIESVSGYNWFPKTLPVDSDPDARPSRLIWTYAQQDEGRLLWQDRRADAGDLYESFIRLPLPSNGAFFFDEGTAPRIVNPGLQGDATEPAGTFWTDDRSGVPQIFSWYVNLSAPYEGAVAPTGAAQTQPSSSTYAFGYIPEDPPPPVVVWTDMRNPATAPDIYAQNLGPGGPGQSGVGDHLPTRVSLSNAIPTPTRGTVTFTLRLPAESDVMLDITDVTGRRVHSALHQRMGAGDHAVRWNGLDEAGRRVAPGLYWLHGRAGGEVISRRIVVISD